MAWIVFLFFNCISLHDTKMYLRFKSVFPEIFLLLGFFFPLQTLALPCKHQFLFSLVLFILVFCFIIFCCNLISCLLLLGTYYSFPNILSWMIAHYFWTLFYSFQCCTCTSLSVWWAIDKAFSLYWCKNFWISIMIFGET